MARPLAEAVLAEPGPLGRRRRSSVSATAARCSSAAVKAAARAARSRTRCSTTATARRRPAQPGSEVGASTTSDRPAFTTDGATWVLDPDDARAARAGLGRRRAVRARGPHPARLLQGPEKTAATFRTDADGVRWVVPGDLATIDDRRPHRAVRPRLGLHQHRRREGVPRRGRGGAQVRTPTCSTRSSSACPTSASASGSSRSCSCATARRARRSTRCRSTAARCSPATRCRAQLLLGDAPRTQHGQARLRDRGRRSLANASRAAEPESALRLLEHRVDLGEIGPERGPTPRRRRSPAPARASLPRR